VKKGTYIERKLGEQHNYKICMEMQIGSPSSSYIYPSSAGLKQAKGLISEPSARRTKDLLKLNRDQLRWIVGLFTGHCHLKGHLFKLGLMDDLTCERCLEADESATHILCDCEAIAHLRFCHLGQFFMEPSDFYDAPVSKIVHLI
jgi:hypothetical protein